MGILDEELHVHVDVHVNNDRGIVDNVVMQILKVAFLEPQSLNPFYQRFFVYPVQFLGFVVHVDDSVSLESRQTIIGGTF